MYRVEQFVNKNQFILRGSDENEGTIFQSYNSIICVVNNMGIKFGRNWDYSQTTLKHLYLFLQEYCWRNIWSKIEDSKNKRKALQKMIDNGELEYDDNLV